MGCEINAHVKVEQINVIGLQLFETILDGKDEALPVVALVIDLKS